MMVSQAYWLDTLTWTLAQIGYYYLFNNLNFLKYIAILTKKNKRVDNYDL